MNVLVPYLVAPMVPAPTCQGASDASAMEDTLALSVIRTLTTVTPTRASMVAPARMVWAPFPVLASVALLVLAVLGMWMNV